MSLLVLAWRNLAFHRVATLITALALALAGGLVMAIFSIQAQAQQAFLLGAPGYDAVLGARGSPLQLVLNAVFQLETSPGNLPLSLVEEVSREAGVVRAVPLAMGDNYRGFRIVGTVLEFFTDPPEGGLRFTLESGGRWFDPKTREAVVGDFAARKADLKLGSSFRPSHGLVASPDSHEHEEEYVVVGILQPTGTPIDRVVWIPLEGVLRMDGHVLRGAGQEYHAHAGQEIPHEHQEVSAVLLDIASPQAGFRLDQAINRKGQRATLAYPIGRVVGEVFEKMGWALLVLKLVAYLALVVAAASILASLYNTLHERRREFAVLRALGMSRPRVFLLLLLESSMIGALGVVGALLVDAGLLAAVAHLVRERTGVLLDIWSFHGVLIAGPLGMMGMAAAAGIIPAWRAYSCPVVENLGPG